MEGADKYTIFSGSREHLLWNLPTGLFKILWAGGSYLRDYFRRGALFGWGLSTENCTEGAFLDSSIARLFEEGAMGEGGLRVFID